MRALVVVLMALTVFGTGCAKKQRERGQVRTRGGETVYNPGGGGTPAPGQPFNKSFGDITNYAPQNVQSLVSVTMDPEEDMRLPIHGIAMNGEIRFTSASQDILALGSSSVSVATGSELAIFILDDMTIKDGAKAITIGFKPGYNGYQVSGTVGGGQAQLTFRDQYGDIYLQGNYNTNNYSGDFSGTITFKNNSGSHPGQTITLGQFRVPVCGFFHCQ